MKKLVAAVVLLVVGAPVLAQRRNAPAALRIALETKLGVKEEVTVSTTDAPSTRRCPVVC